MTGLPQLHTADDVATALGNGATDYYVREQCRKRLWPHRRLARGQVAFTADDFAQILELIAEPVADQTPTTGLAFAPRSRRGAA